MAICILNEVKGMKLNMKKIRIFIIALIVILLLITTIIVMKTLNNKKEVQYIKNTVYCDKYLCYQYKNNTLTLFEEGEEDEQDVAIKSCKINKKVNKCGINIIKWNKNYLLVRYKNYIRIFKNIKIYDKEYENQEKKFNIIKKELKGNFFTNNELEIYFVDEKELIVSDKTNGQMKVLFTEYNYALEYYNFNFFFNNKQYKLTYNSINKEIYKF